MLKILKSLFDENKKTLKKYQILIDGINNLEEEMKKLSDDDFKAKTSEFKVLLNKEKTLDDLLIPAFALVREAARRVLGLRMHDVQLLAAITFHKGNVAEQKTGEGKTLSAVPALYLNALTEKGCHLVTVNDYLAKVGAGWMAPVFDFLGMSVGVIYSGKGDQPAAVYDRDYFDPEQHDERLRHLKKSPRKLAYDADITYGTNNEFGFDYLRDNMVQTLSGMVQRDHHFAIVDEVDSILIDEARTPLIISAPDTEPTDKYYKFADLIKVLSADTDYTIDEKIKSASLTDHGITKIEKKLGINNLYEDDFDVIHHIENALKARSIYQKDKDYVIKDGEIVIVDEFTGRMMYGRRWSEGLHQAVEAKEGVKIQQESRTLATISFQNYFRMYQKLSGMTGTAETEAEEFLRIYNLDVIVIPTNKPIARIDYPDVIYKTTRAKYAAIAEDIKKMHKNGQPVLVGTTSIAKNDVVSNFLKRKKIPHNVLNAKNHENEAMVVADAGSPGAVTIATNIAGRGVDIVLGGATPDKDKFKDKKAYKKELEKWQKKHDQVIAAGGLFVIGTERHESRRIDNQLRGRSGRQGDAGGSRFYVSLDDEIMRIFGGEQVSKVMSMFNLPEDVPLEHKMVSKAIEQAQVKVEGFHFDSRKRVVEYDDVMNKQREIIYGRRKKILEITESKDQNSDFSLHKDILDNLNADIENIVNMYVPEGFIEIEYQHIVREFAQIVPMDVESQKVLREDIQKEIEDKKNIEPVELIVNKLQKILFQAYEIRRQTIGEDAMKQIESYVSLKTIDKLWMEHLDNLQNLRDGIGLRGYGQKDPLVEYKHEAFSMFERLLENIDYEIGRQIMRVGMIQRPQNIQTIEKHDKASSPINNNSQNINGGKVRIQTTVKRSKSKIGRNDPCWCGSGKKWKKCHFPQLG